MPTRDRGASIGAIESVYRLRFDRFCRVAAAILGDREAARDAVQDAFALAVRRRSGYHGPAPLEAWLWRIVVNRARDERRSAAARVRRERSLAAPPALAVELDDPRELREALAGLPERQRLVLFLRVYADLDYEAIATVLAISPGTVGATLNAARASLRRTLEEVPT
ncbi:MAG TPA: sigma-70 family RNA polymerase sigma factor [Gaiellaceae bacterium]